MSTPAPYMKRLGPHSASFPIRFAHLQASFINGYTLPFTTFSIQTTSQGIFFPLAGPRHSV